VLKTFKRGGIHPQENKLSADREIQDLPLPSTVFISAGQHTGVPAAPVVKKGDKVRTGQLIAQSAGFVSANIHSSVSGTVTKLDEIPDTSGYPRQGIVIQVEGDEWEATIDRSPELYENFSCSGDEIIQKIQDAGIVGMGGAAFPTHVKLIPPKGTHADLLIINGVECEPYLTSDGRLMVEKSGEIVVGTRLLMKALHVEKAVIGIENNKPEAIERMRQAVNGKEGISIVPLKVKYPQGGEKQLIKSVTGKEVPSGALPVSVGCVVNNVATAFAVYEAVQKNKPLFERIVTVTGEGVQHPSNVRVRIGTLISELVSFAGGMPENTGKIVNGGPMMRKAISSLDIPVTKGTSGILLFPAEASARKETLNCIRCSRCTTGCPMGLEPFLLMLMSEKQMWDRLELARITDCIECGSCSFICPAHRPLLDYIRYGKARVFQNIRKRKN